jgi:RNA polymerase sigma-70 factor (ECF subfamily)
VGTDAELYAAWHAGDSKAGGQLVDRHLGAIGRFFANKVTNETDMEDLVGETFERCAKTLGKFRHESSFRAYLYGIANNVLRDYIRKKHKLQHEVDLRTTCLRDLGPTPSTALGERREQVLLLQALRAIPFDCQIVLELSYFESMSRRQIAEILEVPAGTVASRIRRGRELLFSRIEELAESPALLHSTMSDIAGWADGLKAQLEDEA